MNSHLLPELRALHDDAVLMEKYQQSAAEFERDYYRREAELLAAENKALREALRGC